MTLATDRRDPVLAKEKDSRASWAGAVAAVPDSVVAERSLPDERSVKDLVAHVAAWERWGEDRLAARIEGRPLLEIPAWDEYEHAFNARTDERWREEPWEVVRSEAADSYAAFWTRVEELDEAQLERAEGLITACGSAHYEEYIEQIRALVDRQPPRTAFETARLRLRSLRPSDAAALFEMFSDPEVMRFIPPGPTLNAERVRRSVDRRIALEREAGLTLWAVARKDDPATPIGQCGFALVEGSGPEVEMAYHYAKRAWGRGLATEAATACLARGFERLGLERVIAICYPENVASWRVMEKAGMHFEGEGDYYGIRMKRYVAERATWRPPR